jgi:hypothetical protein
MASTRKSRAKNWVETEKILTGVMYYGDQCNWYMCSLAQDRKRTRFISLYLDVVKALVVGGAAHGLRRRLEDCAPSLQ